MDKNWSISASVGRYALLISAMLVLLLSGMGRSWWCSCSEFIPWSFEVFSRHNSQHILDWYTFSHIIHGFIFYWLLTLFLPSASLGKRLILAMLIESSWEIAENSSFIIDRYRTVTMALDYYGDSIANSLSDLCACTLGFLFAAKVPGRITALLGVLFELFTLVMIRDNLTLNVLMLIWPIDEIRVWQSLIH